MVCGWKVAGRVGTGCVALSAVTEEGLGGVSIVSAVARIASRLPIVPAIVTVALSASGTAVWLHLPVAGSRRSAKSLPSTSSSALTHRILSVAETSSIACAFVGVIAVTIGTLRRSEEHTSELQSLMRISYAVF